MNKKQRITLARIILAAVSTAVIIFLPADETLKLTLYIAVFLLIGFDVLIKAVKGIFNLQPFDENFLMAAAAVGAFFLGDGLESVAVMLFYQIGEFFQGMAVARSRRSITALMDICPDYANILRENNETEKVSPDEVEIGSLIRVLPGEKFPIDGVITEGSGAIDNSALTGESVPLSVHPGDEVPSGSINLTGVLTLKTVRGFEDSTASKILELVENASSRKSHSEQFISKFARVYTPLVCIAALLLAVVPPLVSLFSGVSPEWGVWIYRALSFLVISCPCALVISIPLAFFAGLGGSGRSGILIKGSNFMEKLAHVDTVALDKTGTLTKGVFEVTAVLPAQFTSNELLNYAASAEAFSTHPIAKSILRAHGGTVDKSRVSDIHEDSGRGVSACVDGHRVLVGNDLLMEDNGIPYDYPDTVSTVIHVAVDGAYAGNLWISDIIKENSARAISALKDAGVRHTVLVTGDSAGNAKAVASGLGINEIHSGVLPADKVDIIEKLISELGRGEALAFVGDGINDAPVLTRADIGIAMGALGSNAAIEAADVVLMDDDPMKISKAIRIGRRTIGIVYQNLVFSISVKLACLVLSALGITNMWTAIFADVGVMVIAVLNAIRAMNVKNV